MTDPNSDTQLDRLLQRWHAGDRAALEELIEQNLEWIQQRVRQRLGGLLRAKAETQDYVHDAMIEVLRYGPKFVTANRAQFRSLIAKIIENVLRDRHEHLAAKRREPARERALPSDSVVWLDGGYDAVKRPSEDAMRNEREAWIRLALELLEPDDRKVILLRQHDDLAFKEIGEILGISENTARMRFQRALPKLAAKVGQLQDRG